MMKSLQTAAALGALLMVPLAATAQGLASTGPITAEERAALTPSRAMLERGWDVANTACASCHNQDGISRTAGVPHLAGQRMVYLHRVMQAYQQRERHNDDMNHAIGFLNEEAILSAAAYYASLTPARVQPSGEGSMDAVQVKGGDPFATIREDMNKCVKCHGEDGNASASGMPNLTAQDPANYFSQHI